MNNNDIDEDDVDAVIEQWRHARPDLDLWPVEVLARMTRLAAVLNRSFDEVFAEHGLRHGEFDVLSAIRRSGPPFTITPSALSQHLMLSRAGITNRLDRLEKAGKVTRQIDSNDRRSFIIALTDDGLATVDTALTDHAANEARLLAGLTRNEQETMNTLLRHLLADLDPLAP